MRIVDAAAEPLSVEDATDHVKGLADDAAALTTQIVVARQAAENHTHTALFAQTWRLSLDAFPSWTGADWQTSRYDAMAILLPRPPLLSVTSVQYRDLEGAWQTLDPAAYLIDADALPPRLYPAAGTNWPTTQCVPNAVRVTFVAGYADPTFDNSEAGLVDQALMDAQAAALAAARAAVPAPVRAAMLLMIGDKFRNREGQIVGVTVTENPEARKLLAGYRYVEAR